MASTSEPHRTVHVAYERLPGWLERFAKRHGDVETVHDGTHVRLSAPDGAVADYDDIAPPERFGLVLVRRGGYAVGLVEDGRVTASKCGTRYVQGKTKAGGWSQQRYARRRANQADQLTATARDAIERVLDTEGELPAYGGGDRELVRRAVADSHSNLALSSRWLQVGEPRRATLDEAAKQARSVSITLNDRA